MHEMAFEQTEKRYAAGSTSRDVFFYLVRAAYRRTSYTLMTRCLQNNEDGAEKVNPSKELVLSDGLLAIGAGADTTASVLSNTFWLLLRHPQCYKRLQEEVDQFYPPGSDSLDPKYHPQMHYLDAVM